MIGFVLLEEKAATISSFLIRDGKIKVQSSFWSTTLTKMFFSLHQEAISWLSLLSLVAAITKKKSLISSCSTFFWINRTFSISSLSLEIQVISASNSFKRSILCLAIFPEPIISIFLFFKSINSGKYEILTSQISYLNSNII